MEALAEHTGPTYAPPARPEIVQFRVVATVPAAPYLVVDPATTKVIQKGAVNSAGVPRARRRSGPQLAEALALLGAALRCGLPGRVLVEGRGVSTLRRAAEALGLAVVRIDCRQLAGSEATAQQNIAYTVREAAEVAPALLILEDVQALDPPPQGAEKREGRAAEALRRALADAPLLLVAATSPALADLDPGLRSVFLHELRFPSPDLAARQAWIAGRRAVSLLSSSLDVARLAQRTAGLTQAQLRALLARATDRAYSAALPRLGPAGHARRHLDSLVTVSSEEVEAVLDAQQSSKRSTKIPSVKWEDVGGLAHVKDAILEVIQLPLQRPELFQDGRRRSGILLYGPPGPPPLTTGTGKTLVAKAVATECSLNFLNVKGPELINMYVGESERNIRDIFARARAARPCVIFFDELDSLAPARGAGADSGGVMDRVVSQLLAELDGRSSG